MGQLVDSTISHSRRREHIPVTHAAGVQVGSCDFSGRVDAETNRPLEHPRTCAGSVQAGNRPVCRTQEAVYNCVCISVRSGNYCRGVDAEAAGTLDHARTGTRTRRIKRSYDAIRSAYKAVTDTVRICVVSGNVPRIIDTDGFGARPESRSPARCGSLRRRRRRISRTPAAGHIKGSYRSVSSPDIPVINIVFVLERPGDHPGRVDAYGLGSLTVARARTRSIERRYPAA